MGLRASASANVTITDDPALASSHTMVVGERAMVENHLRPVDVALLAAAVRLVAAAYAITRTNTTTEPTVLAPYGLTSREREVALLLLDGASNKAIARTLDISVHTAKFHAAALLAKLRARNRADAVAVILREGLVPV
jgi:DNA-binding NarL/FixJ family response regulator